MTPWTLETVPKPTLMLRRRDDPTKMELVTSWWPDGLLMPDQGIVTWDMLEYYEHSTDGNTWLPCGTPESEAS